MFKDTKDTYDTSNLYDIRDLNDTTVPTNNYYVMKNAFIPLFDDVRLQNYIAKLFSIGLIIYKKKKLRR